MTSFRKFEANRRNALHSTGPKTEEGKQRSRLNAIRHGLTAETVVGRLEDSEDYKAFEATIIADYCAETAVARELVLRLASLLWRLRRATAIETDLFEIQAEALAEWQSGDALCTKRRSQNSIAGPLSAPSARALLRPINGQRERDEDAVHAEYGSDRSQQIDDHNGRRTRQLTYSFLRLANLDSGVFERLNRYEAALWRQAVQIIFALQPIKQR
jgi:hypothetical protein